MIGIARLNSCRGDDPFGQIFCSLHDRLFKCAQKVEIILLPLATLILKNSMMITRREFFESRVPLWLR